MCHHTIRKGLKFITFKNIRVLKLVKEKLVSSSIQNGILQHLYLHQTKLFLSNGVLFWRKIPVATRKWERLVRARCLVSISFALKRETTSKYWAFSFTLFRLCLPPSKKLDADWILDPMKWKTGETFLDGPRGNGNFTILLMKAVSKAATCDAG